MNLLTLFYTVLLSFFGLSLYAQQQALLSSALQNQSINNPAMTGWENAHLISAAYRHQWTGMPNAPQTALINWSNYWENKNMGLSAQIINDQLGPSSATGLHAQYAYHIRLGNEGTDYKRSRLCIGLGLQVQQLRLDGSALNPLDLGDPLLITSQQNIWSPNASAGIFYYNDLYHFGLSAPQLIPLDTRFENNAGQGGNLKRSAHFILQAGVKTGLKDGKISTSEKAMHHFMPTLAVRYTAVSPLLARVHRQYRWQKRLFAGVAFASNQQLSFDVGIRLKQQLIVNYYFELPLSNLVNQLGTTHSIGINYIINSNGKGWLHPTLPIQNN
jgi:type IX secretion system PorP/SprF family membrane protein